jgi:hypothetical protein
MILAGSPVEVFNSSLGNRSCDGNLAIWLGHQRAARKSRECRVKQLNRGRFELRNVHFLIFTLDYDFNVSCHRIDRARGWRMHKRALWYMWLLGLLAH